MSNAECFTVVFLAILCAIGVFVGCRHLLSFTDDDEE